MPIDFVYSDEYKGPTYTYFSPLRPIPATLLPSGYTAVITVGSDPRIVVTTKPLPERFVEQFSLERRSADEKITDDKTFRVYFNRHKFSDTSDKPRASSMIIKASSADEALEKAYAIRDSQWSGQAIKGPASHPYIGMIHRADIIQTQRKARLQSNPMRRKRPL